MLNKIYKICFLMTIVMMPMFTYALLEKTETFFEGAKYLIKDILTPLAFLLALLCFFWGVAKYIWSSGTEKDEGKKIMIWGIVALFVMSSIWGIIYFVRGEIGIENTSDMPIPTFQ